MIHAPICPMCGEHEVGTLDGNEHFCSDRCEQESWYEGEGAESFDDVVIADTHVFTEV